MAASHSMAGSSTFVYVLCDGTSGRAYIGVNADANGAFSVVAAWNTDKLILQENSNYSYNHYHNNNYNNNNHNSST